MTDAVEPIRIDRPLRYAGWGTLLLAIGGVFLTNLEEDPGIFIVFTTVFAAPGLYLLLAGAVARGIQVARR